MRKNNSESSQRQQLGAQAVSIFGEPKKCLKNSSDALIVDENKSMRHARARSQTTGFCRRLKKVKSGSRCLAGWLFSNFPFTRRLGSDVWNVNASTWLGSGEWKHFSSLPIASPLNELFNDS
jgi:hypothetical protein